MPVMLQPPLEAGAELKPPPFPLPGFWARAFALAIDVALLRARLASVSGFVTGSDGEPLGGTVTIRPVEGGISRSAPVDVDGQFRFGDCSAGTYILQAHNLRSAPGEARQISFAKVSVGVDDVQGVFVRPLRLATGRGRIVGDVATLPPLQVGVIPASPEGVLGPQRPGAVRPDGTFEFQSWPGRMYVRVVLQSPDWMMKAVHVNGVDATDEGIEFTDGQELTGMEIELTNRLSGFSGDVTTSDGDPAGSYVVIVFPQSAERRQNSRYFAISRADQHGRFLVRSLPPGKYFAVALDAVPPGNEWMDVDYLERIRASATATSIADGENKTLQLKLKPGL